MKLLISRTFEEVTPESAEDGEVSDSGFVYEAQEFTFSELVREISRDGFFREGATEWLTTHVWVDDYATGTERREALHFDRANPEHLRKYFELALRFSNRR